ncbi:MAG: DUF4149 domain-containing protein [Alphaproteobacteria bacterium]
MFEFLNDLSIFLIPFLIGSLVFFSSIVAPNTFINLDEKSARKFIRTLFPKIYTYAAILSLLISIFLLKVEVFYSFIFFVISLGYIYSKFFLMKKINDASDMKDDNKFKILHRFSVIIFILQLILMGFIYYLLMNQ